ncbi:MAG TPA: hypothetical protein ENH05_08840 [Rhizobiales bacterium]|nr:hypothetical protein BMS3Bbin10_02002 [bacterium BMS3Bbin10]HDO52826.1 hypothetical protein [Hyphomicrobiales bacterium]
MTIRSMPDLSSLEYGPQNFRDLAETEFGANLWDFLKRPDNLIRIETATLLERVAVEPLAAGLVAEFGVEIRDDRTKQMIGHMTRQVMEALGYELDRTSLRITRPNLFTSGATYRRPGRGDRPMKITREQREAWAKNTANSPFNIWLSEQVKRSDGTLSLKRLYKVARRYGITKRYDGLNPGQQRMNIGVMLRTRVLPEEYENHS